MSLNIGSLFRSPHKWTPRHLEGLNLEVQQETPVARVIGESFVPDDEDQLFATLSHDFSRPTKEELLRQPKFREPEYKNNEFVPFFSQICKAQEAFDAGQSTLFQLHDLVCAFLPYFGSMGAGKFLFNYLDLTFHLSSFNVNGRLRLHGGGLFSMAYPRLPLAIFSFYDTASHHVLPYVLFQCIMKYELDPSMEEYAGMLVSMRGTTFQFIRGSCSQKYLTELVRGRAPSGNELKMRLYYSRTYDLWEQDDRREFVGPFLGMLRWMCHSVKHLDRR